MTKTNGFFTAYNSPTPIDTSHACPRGEIGQLIPEFSELVSFSPLPGRHCSWGRRNAGRLVIIDPKTLEILWHVFPAGGNLHELATDGRYVYIGSNLPGNHGVWSDGQKRVGHESVLWSPTAITLQDTSYLGHETSAWLTIWFATKAHLTRSLGCLVVEHAAYHSRWQRIFTASSTMAGDWLLSIV